MKISNESNSAKSRNGNDLNALVKDLLNNCMKRGLIKSFVFEPRYSHPSTSYEQFSPDFEITLNDDSIIIIDNTTTARHDRFKQKQWDAFGVKEYFKSDNKTVKYYVVLPDNDNIGSDSTREKEIRNYLNEKNKLYNGTYFSMIDDIIQISDLVNIIESANFANV